MNMTESFIQKLAEARAKEIFTPDFFLHNTDSWFLDEVFRFEGLKVGEDGRKPYEKELDIYMKYMNSLFQEYKDKYYGDALAQNAYGECIDFFHRIFDTIEIANKTCSQFNIDEETIQKLKDIANIFVYKHNEFCK